MRGLFRSWFHRLAAREALQSNTEVQIADDAALYVDRESTGQYTADNLGIGFQNKQDESPTPSKEFWPVAGLFGSLRQRGRIKITDGLSACSSLEEDQCDESQLRMHVAVDRITGGASKGLLFKNRVLTSSATSFCFHLEIREPQEYEVVWLAKTLRAVDLGILRIGSSKSAGRLEFAHEPKPDGKFHKIFQTALDSKPLSPKPPQPSEAT